MKKVYVLLALSSIISVNSFAQSVKIVTPQEYDNLKANKQLQENTIYFQKPGPEVQVTEKDKVVQNDAPYTVNRAANATCQCMLPVDGTFSLVPMAGYTSPYRNDDGSSNAIAIPFNFCMYGTQYTDLYINNNGNVSFGSSYSTFSSSPFPSSSYTMVAPFWGDVDTRGAASGLVYYKMTANYMVVRWQTVGYYSNYTDKLNDFQLIISDGTDTLIPGNNNVAFCYNDMQWTTGDASSGVGGFGGIPSTVGINKGDGVNYVQLGRFDQPGAAYDGPYGNPDGIDWLDNQTFYFDVCGSSTNLPPIITSANAYSCTPDTILLCTNSDTLIRSIQFTGPENNQTITPTVSAPTLPGALTTSSSTVGGVTTITFTLVANPGVVGLHTITITGTDNGTPPLSTSISYIVNVPNVTLPNPVLAVSPSGPICANVGATVSLNNCSQYTNIQWADGSNGCSVLVTQTGTTYVTVIATNGCTKTSFMNVNLLPLPEPTITGNLNFCNSAGTNLSTSISGSTASPFTYAWSGVASGSGSSTMVMNSGQVIVTVTDANGCTGDDTVTVTNNTPPVFITPSTTSFCPGVPVTLTGSIPQAGSVYTWNSNPSGAYPATQSITVNPAVSTTYTVSVLNNGCTSTNTITMNPQSQAIINSIMNPHVCPGQTPTLIASASPGGSTVTWTPSTGPVQMGNSITGTPGVTYTVQATISGQCPSADSVVTAWPFNPGVTTDIFDTDPSTPDTILCFKSNKFLTENVTSGVAPYTYHWAPASGSNSTNDTCKILLSGSYTLTVTDANGCIGKDSIDIDLIQPILTLTGTAFVCPGDTAMIVTHGSSPGGFSISWTPAGFGTNDTIYTSMIGQYQATITDNIYGCTEQKFYTIGNYPVPNANFTASPEPSEMATDVVFQNTSTISTGTVTQFMWNFGDDTLWYGSQMTINHNYPVPGTYPVTLIVKSNRGCYDTISIDHEVYVVIPIVNIITPNNDNTNNTLRFRGLEYFPNSKIDIYNRWGKKIYESANYDNKWDGKDMEEGTYYYILEVPGLKPQDNKISSFFQIIR